jgi:hypothetical protein
MGRSESEVLVSHLEVVSNGGGTRVREHNRFGHSFANTYIAEINTFIEGDARHNTL